MSFLFFSDKRDALTDQVLPAPLNSALNRIGFKTLTDVQKRSIPAIMGGQDVVVMAPTGTGKTAAFVVPVIAKLMSDPESHALILTPTRELAEQIMAFIRQLTATIPDLHVGCFIGGRAIGGDLKTLRKSLRMIVATPGRMIDLLSRRHLRLAGVTHVILDEADRMFDMGFASQVEEILEQTPKERQTLLFSATYTKQVENSFRPFLKNPVRIVVGSAKPKVAQGIEQQKVEVQQEKKNTTVVEKLATVTGQSLVFTRTKHRADRLAKFLLDQGFSCVQIHGNRSQAKRKKALDGFRSGTFQILVATDVAARGLDIPKVEQVINFDFPATSDDYLHRVGRTGRAGHKGTAISFVTPNEVREWHRMQKHFTAR